MSVKQIKIKRCFDVVIAIMGIVVFAPLFLLIALLIKLILGSPVFFSQFRPGLDGMSFKIYKFRTMTDKRNRQGILWSDERRSTRFGQFLRNTSLDELPELWNILKGNMSSVGPRPLLNEYLDRYTSEQARRHEMLPGITGWAQVNGRNAISWEEKFKLDVWYVDNWSLWLDTKILFLTIWKTARRENINQSGQATMSKFIGTGKNV